VALTVGDTVGVALAIGDNVALAVGVIVALVVGFNVALAVAVFDAFGLAFVEALVLGDVDTFGESVGFGTSETLLHASFPEEFLLHTTRLIPSVLVALILLHALPVFTAIAEAGKVT
jgi:hypothetical protein